MSARTRQLLSGCGAVVVSAAFAASPAKAYDSSDARVPAPTYAGINEVVYATAGGEVRIHSFFDVFADFERMAPPPDGPPAVDSFFDVFTELTFQAPGVSQTGPLSANGAWSIQRRPGLPPGEPVVYDTEMLAMNLQGSALPPGVLIRESPTLPSRGLTTITELAGGMYRIDSFFDVFTELSIDGGQSWTPGAQPLRIVGGLPEPASLTLVGLAAAALALCGRRCA